MSDDKTAGTGDATPKSAFDLDVLQEQTAGDPSLTKELVQLCLDECPALMVQLRKAVADRDATGIRFAAHTLKGALMNFGAQRAVAASLQLEMLGQAQTLENVDEVHRELGAAWTELEWELTAYLR